MSFKFECPHCGQRISVEEDQAGIAAACPTCENEIVIPTLIALGKPPIPTPASSPLKAARRSRVWVAAGCLASLLALGGVLVLHRETSAPAPAQEKRPMMVLATPTTSAPAVPAQNHLEPEQLLDRYFACKTWRERMPLLRDPDRVEPLMAQYYQSAELPQGIDRRYESRRELYGSLVIPVRMKSSEKAEVTKFYWFTKSGNDYRIDWEASSTWNPISWAAYRSDRSTEPHRFRCVIGLSDSYYHSGFSDRTEWLSVDLEGSNLKGYARRGSKTGDALRALLDDGGTKFAIVDVRFPNSSGTEGAVEVVRLVTPGWVLHEHGQDPLGSWVAAVAQTPGAQPLGHAGEDAATRIESAVKDGVGPKSGTEAFAIVSGISFDGIKSLPLSDQPKAMAVASLRMAAWMLGMGSLAEAEKAAPNGLPGDDSRRAVIAELTWRTLGEPVFLRDSQKFAQYISPDDQIELAHREFKRGFFDGLAIKDPVK